jgi:microcompartment protein CcmK/EutM
MRRRVSEIVHAPARSTNVFIGKVTGSVVASQKVESVRGHKLLAIEAYRVTTDTPPKLESTGRVAIAVDALGAGEGEFVLVTQGSSARLTDATKNLPVDAVVVGIVDTVQLGAHCAYNKQD